MGVEEIHWNVVPLNYDLYNGIGDIAVFLHSFCETYKDSGYDDLCLAIDNSLDEYLLSILEYDVIYRLKEPVGKDAQYPYPLAHFIFKLCASVVNSSASARVEFNSVPRMVSGQER